MSSQRYEEVKHVVAAMPVVGIVTVVTLVNLSEGHRVTPSKLGHTAACVRFVGVLALAT